MISLGLRSCCNQKFVNARLSGQQFVKKSAVLRAVGGRNVGGKSAPLQGFLVEHSRPTDGLSVFGDPGLDGFEFCRQMHNLN